MNSVKTPLILVLIAVLAFVTQSGYQTFEMLSANDRLRAQIAAQEPSVQDAQKVRAQLLSIAGQTAVLADDGNASARLLVERLKAQGVTITPPAKR